MTKNTVVKIGMVTLTVVFFGLAVAEEVLKWNALGKLWFIL